MMNRLIPFLAITVLVVAGCTTKTEQTTSGQVDEEASTDTARVFDELPDTDWDYSGLYGRYVHESSTSGFAATLLLEPQGLNIAFTIVSSKGESCRGEASGNIAMVDHSENYDTGYWIEEDCKLEFIFRRTDKKVDVKEIHLCTLHDSLCGFEGTYAKSESVD